MKPSLTLMAVLVLSIVLTGQTRVTPPQLVTAPVSSTLVGILAGRFAMLTLDSGSFLIDSSTTPATIRLLSAGTTEVVEVFRPVSPQATFTLADLPKGASLQITLNGLVQTSPEDYSVASRTVTLVGAFTGDVLQFRYRK